MNRIAKSFGQGLLIVAPIGITVAVIWTVVSALDKCLNAPFWGAGLLITVAAVTAIGYFGRNVAGKRIMRLLERGLKRVPFVNLLYNSLRDLFGAFVGERKSFEKPVFVEVAPNGVKVFGFMTCEWFEDPQLANHVSVYLPQSYNFAGNTIIVPKHLVHSLDADGPEFMAFVVSGGVTDMHASKTAVDFPA